MFREMLYVQWKWARAELALYTVIGFAVPTAVLQGVSRGLLRDAESWTAAAVLGASRSTGGFLVSLAVVAGITIAARPYANDEARGHVLTLSLPIAWARFVRYRFTAGALLLLIPAVGIWLGGALGALTLSLPPTLHVYPTSIALRFWTATLAVSAAALAAQYGWGRRAARNVAILIVAAALLQVVGEMVLGWSPIGELVDALAQVPGPFELFAAPWMLVDV